MNIDCQVVDEKKINIYLRILNNGRISDCLFWYFAIAGTNALRIETVGLRNILIFHCVPF
jgi:hypothetical protein